MDGLSCIFDRFHLSLCNAEWFMPMIYRRIEAWIISPSTTFLLFYHVSYNTVDSNKTICYYQLS